MADGAAAPRSGHSALAWAPWLIVLAVVATYANAFAGDFQFDDAAVIVGDPRVQSLRAWWTSMPGIRPLLKLTYAANHSSGLGIAGFHAVNVALHAGNAVLVWSLLRRLGPRVPGAALLGALLFALHPVQTEAVTYVSGRSSSLSASFALASILAWVVGRERSRPWLAGAASPIFLVASLLVKETAVVVPLALVLVDAAFGPRPFLWRAALRSTAVHWAVVAVALAALLASPTYRSMAARSLALRPGGSNLLVHVEGLGWLAGQVARIDRLDADPDLPATGARTPAVAAEAGLLVLALAAGLVLLHRGREAGFALLWFLVWLPASGWILPRPEPANDRQLYLALVGPAWIAGRWLSAPFRSGGWRRAGVLGLLALLCGVTVARNRVYADAVRFWEDVVRKSPGNARARNNLGCAFAARCRLPEAEAAFVRALELDRGYVRAAVNLRLLRDGAPLTADPGHPDCPPPPWTPLPAR